VAVQSARATAMPGIPEMGEVWGPANAALELSLTGKQPPQARSIMPKTDQDADRGYAGQQPVIAMSVILR
jgi:maltose-binding protein MalE